MIVNRYLITEVVKSTMALLMVLILIGLSNEFVIWLSRAASGQLPASLVLEVVWLNFPILLCILLPLAFFFGILLAFGRLYADSEMVVLLACGFGLKQQLRTMLGPVLVFSAAAAAFNLYLAPEAMQKLEYLVQRARADVASQGLNSGRFQTSDDGRFIIFAENISKDKRTLQEIFIAERPPDAEPDKNWAVVSAARGFRHWDKNLGAEYFVLQNGYRYEGNPGKLDFTVLKFAEFGMKINFYKVSTAASPQSLSTKFLWNSDDIDNFAELNWRFALIIAIGIVALLAVPVARVAPRKGKYSTLVPGMLIVISYVNALVLANTWLKDGLIELPRFMWWGMWWVHLIGVFVALLLIGWRENWWRRMRVKLI